MSHESSTWDEAYGSITHELDVLDPETGQRVRLPVRPGWQWKRFPDGAAEDCRIAVIGAEALIAAENAGATALAKHLAALGGPLSIATFQLELNGLRKITKSDE